jgi:hypothetical protein
LAPAALAVAAVLLIAPIQAQAKNGYDVGYYSGRTSQGNAITFVVSGGKVSELLSRITDSCNPCVIGIPAP